MPEPSFGTLSRPATELSEPRIEDAAAIWDLVRETGVLDVNSPYAYLLVCAHHAATSAVARTGGRLLGFVSAYRVPERPGTLFVWQVAVGKAARGTGLATRMLLSVLARPALRDVRYVETTVTPSNLASRRLFEGVALRLDAALEINAGFAEGDFPTGDHEAEELFRIGPIRRSP